MKKIVLFLLSGVYFFFLSEGKAQQTTFTEVIMDSMHYGIQSSAAVQGLNSDYAILCSQISASLITINSNGSILTATSYADTTNVFISPTFNAIIGDVDSSYVVTGHIYNTITNKFDVLCVKLDGIGHVIWANTISKSNTDFQIIKISRTLDSGYILIGSLGAYNGMVVIKLDHSGNLQWTNTLSGPADYYTGVSIYQTADSGYIVGGNVEVLQPLLMEPCLIKLTSTGTVSWAKKYHWSSSNYGSFNDVSICNDGYLCYLYMGGNVFLLKTDFSGNEIWNKAYSQPAEGSTLGMGRPSMHLTLDSNYIFRSGGYWGSVMSKADKEGNIIWSRSLLMNGIDVIETADSGYLCVGNGPMLGVKQNSFISPQIALVKTDINGYSVDCFYNSNINTITATILVSPLSLTSVAGGISNAIQFISSPFLVNVRTGCVDVEGGINETNTDKGIELYPNPTTGILNIKGEENSEIEIYSVTGQLLIKNKIVEKLASMNLSSLPSGIYFARIKNAESIQYKQIIKQ